MNYLLAMTKKASWAAGGQTIFPIGLAYISSSLKAAGHEVLTTNLEVATGSTFDELKALVLPHQIDVLCTSGLSRDYNKVKETLEAARAIKKNILTVVGGGLISSDPETAMRALGADIGVIGEGEHTMCDLATALDNASPIDHIPGLIIRNADGNYIMTPDRPEIDNLDIIPFPDFAGFSYDQTLRASEGKHVYVLGSRSCPFSCTFCFHPAGNKYRQRSLDNLFAEIDLLIKTYRASYLYIADEVFALRKERVYEFCRRIAPYGIRWSSTLRVTDVDRDMLHAMRSSGCDEICFGVEHTENEVLKSMRKHITLDQIERALQLAYDNHIDVVAGILFGDIAETKQTAENALMWHSRHTEYGLMLNMVDVFPGTHLYTYACERGLIKDKVQFLKDGCPQVNLTSMPDDEYKALASRVYEANMRAFHPPKSYAVTNLSAAGTCTVQVTCDRCGALHTTEADILYTLRVNCPECNQCHYVDPFAKVATHEESVKSVFCNAPRVALWGAGEVCIKLLSKYSFFGDAKFIIVDQAKSRQGRSICGKTISPPDIINSEEVPSVIVAVTRRVEEVLQEISVRFPSVIDVWLPDVTTSPDGMAPIFRHCEVTRGSNN